MQVGARRRVVVPRSDPSVADGSAMGGAFAIRRVVARGLRAAACRVRCDAPYIIPGERNLSPGLGKRPFRGMKPSGGGASVGWSRAICSDRSTLGIATEAFCEILCLFVDALSCPVLL